jgi:hypothetical protein
MVPPCWATHRPDINGPDRSSPRRMRGKLARRQTYGSLRRCAGGISRPECGAVAWLRPAPQQPSSISKACPCHPGTPRKGFRARHPAPDSWRGALRRTISLDNRWSARGPSLLQWSLALTGGLSSDRHRVRSAGPEPGHVSSARGQATASALSKVSSGRVLLRAGSDPYCRVDRAFDREWFE